MYILKDVNKAGDQDSEAMNSGAGFGGSHQAFFSLFIFIHSYRTPLLSVTSAIWMLPICQCLYFGLCILAVLFGSRFYCDFVSPVSAILDPHLFDLVSAAPALHCFTCPSLVQFVYIYIYTPCVSSLVCQIVLAL